VFGGIAAAALVLGIVLLLAGRMAKLIPLPLVHFLTRVFGLLLSAVAVQLIVDAVRVLIREG
jgi:small neutral amino acid transporter SnatA (MarC family)